ncbi:MAG: hypothetical protein OWR52_12765, partial [Acidibacillus sp.]|nr:hypothetical protein [Acidibacillus sp.]
DSIMPEIKTWTKKLFLYFKSLFKNGAGKTRAVQGSEPRMWTERTFWVREGAFLALTLQCAGKF